MRFSVLQAGTALPEMSRRVGGYGKMFVDLLRQPGETWEIHNVEKGQFPQNPERYRGFVITGSSFSVNDSHAWIGKLLRFLGESHKQGIRLLGICFGHQAVARALGGHVRPNPLGWDLGLGEVNLTGDAAIRLGISPVLRNDPLRILQTHRDIVERLPPGALHLGWSKKTRYEMFSLDETVLCMQGHPEFDKPGIREIVEALLKQDKISFEEKNAALSTLQRDPEQTLFQEIMIRFLHASIA